MGTAENLVEARRIRRNLGRQIDRIKSRMQNCSRDPKVWVPIHSELINKMVELDQGLRNLGYRIASESDPRPGSLVLITEAWKAEQRKKRERREALMASFKANPSPKTVREIVENV